MTLACLSTLIWGLAFAQALSTEEIAEKAAPAVVQIIVYDITGARSVEGSGFFIGSGKIITNAHVVNGAYSAEVLGSLATYKDVTILKNEYDIDLALLQVKDRHEAHLSLANSPMLRPGQRILTIGNPLGLECTVSDGLISAIRGVPGKIQLIQISAPISPGSSGGPLLDMDGSVIGVTSASLSEGQNLNFAVGIKTLHDFLQQEDEPQTLKRAGNRVLWRTVLKWLVNIVFVLLALAFGEGWWVLFILFCIIAGIYVLVRWLWRLVKYPFRRRRVGSSCADILSRQPDFTRIDENCRDHEATDSGGSEIEENNVQIEKD